MIPTVFGIMAISFLITQFAPGGPVEQALANLSGQNSSMVERISGNASGDFAAQPLGINIGNAAVGTRMTTATMRIRSGASVIPRLVNLSDRAPTPRYVAGPRIRSATPILAAKVSGAQFQVRSNAAGRNAWL